MREVTAREVFRQVRAKVPDQGPADDRAMADLLNSFQNEIVDDFFPPYFRCYMTTTVVKDTAVVNQPPLIRRLAGSIGTVSDSGGSLYPITILSDEKATWSGHAGARGRPRYLLEFYRPDRGPVWELIPVPDKEYSLRVLVDRWPEAVESGKTSTLLINAPHLVVAFMCHHRALENGDYDVAERYEKYFERARKRHIKGIKREGLGGAMDMYPSHIFDMGTGAIVDVEVPSNDD